MEYRKMGKTGLQLSALSFGSWVTFHKQIDDRIADELMGIAYDAGVNFFDNAEVYAGGESEKMMGRVISKKNWDRTSYVLSSKAYFGWRGKENKPNQTGLSRKHLTEACHEALKRLQTEYLDLYFCHRPDKTTPIEEVVHTMNTLIQFLYANSPRVDVANRMTVNNSEVTQPISGTVTAAVTNATVTNLGTVSGQPQQYMGQDVPLYLYDNIIIS